MLGNLLRAYLADSDVSLETPANGELALAKVREQRPDQILMDIGMPVMDGVSAIRSLRDLRDPIPVIAVAAAAMVARAQEAVRLVDAVVTKPVTRARFLEEIARFLPHDPPEDVDPGPARVEPCPEPKGAGSSLGHDAGPAFTGGEQLTALLTAEQGFRAAVTRNLLSALVRLTDSRRVLPL